MRLTQKYMVIVTAAICYVAPTVCVAAVAYTVTDLGTLGGTESRGLGINSSGHVTGYSYTSSGDKHAFLYDGTMHDLGTLGGDSIGNSISDNGQITGSSLSSDGNRRAFIYTDSMHQIGVPQGSVGSGINASGHVTGRYTQVYSHRAFVYDGTMHDIGTLGGSSSRGNAINVNGRVTGSAATIDDLSSHAFLFDGTMHDLGTLGGWLSEGQAINENNQVVGVSYTTGDNEFHAFLYDGAMHDLGTLGGTHSWASGINADGYITGWAHVTGNVAPRRAFLYRSDSGMVDLNTLIDPLSGWLLQEALAINDARQITGYGRIGDEDHAFLLTPVPEPSTLALAALCLLGLVAARIRGRKGEEKGTRLVLDVRTPTGG